MTVREGRRRGNPNWEKKATGAPPWMVETTEFERVTAELGLTTQGQMLKSTQLRSWVQKHMNNRYVPESLLRAMHLEPNINFGPLDAGSC